MTSDDNGLDPTDKEQPSTSEQKESKIRKVFSDFEESKQRFLGAADANTMQMLANDLAGFNKEFLLASVGFIKNLKPRDEIEGALLSQMIVAHMLAMNFAKRAHSLTDPELIDRNVGRTARLMRTFAGHLDAFNRYRGKGQQQIIVKHVHVENGGQAIVGDVIGGGGANEKI